MLAHAVVLALAAAPAVPHTVGATRGGLPLVVVSAPESPWAELRLHVALDALELIPAERARLGELARGLAALTDLTPVGGVARARVGADQLVVSLGAPAGQLDALLRAGQELLLRPRGVKPAARPVEQAHSSEPDLDARALALALQGSPLGLPVEGPPSAEGLGPLSARVLRRERVALALVGPLPEAELLERSARALSAGLPPGPLAPAALALPVSGTRLAEAQDGDLAGARSTLWFLGPGRGQAGAAPKDRAARAVLARLLGGRAESSAAAFAIAVDVQSARAAGIARAEGKLLEAFEGVVRAPPPGDVVSAEAARERAARLERLREVETLADALGRALLAGNAGLVDAELQALQELGPDDITAAAKAAATGPRLIWRVLGSGG